MKIDLCTPWNFLEEFKYRNYFYQCTDETAIADQSKKIVGYIGFDCTAPSLHVGNLMQIMILRLLQKHGHKPIVIFGGATTRIGDPSGKNEARKLLSNEEIEKNITGIKHCLSKFIKFGNDKSDAILLNNDQWLLDINYIDFLRDYGVYFSVNKMLTMDSVKLRLENQQNLSFLEFNYMLLQSYDFLHLHENYGCNLQIGGSDQWGNIVMGVELARRKLGAELYGMTTPLLLTSSGAKMGKSVNGAVWLHEDMLSPYNYFQYWRNTEDNDVRRFSLIFAEYNKDEQEEFDNILKHDINEAKKRLAHRLTELCHSKEDADSALDTAIKVFEMGSVAENLPEVLVSSKKLADNGFPFYELLVLSNFCTSNSEGKRLIRGKGARIDDKVIADENLKVTLDDFKDKDYIKISAGKKNHAIVKLLH